MNILAFAFSVLAVVAFKDASKIKSWDAWADHKKPVAWKERRSVTREKLLKMDSGLKSLGWLKTRQAKDIKSDMWSVGCETLDRDYADWDQYKSFLCDLGATRARFFSGWAKTEQEKGQYDFAWLDKQLRECHAMGIKPWVCISYGNPVWGSDFRLGMRVKQITDNREAFDAWLRYTRTLVARYQDIVDEWEVWNEPFNQDQEYAELFYETAKVIREVQPKATVIATAVYFPAGYVAVLEKLKKENALHLANLFSYHPYLPNPDESYDIGPGPIRKWSGMRIRQLVKSYSSDFDVFQGESGCPGQLEFAHALREIEWTEYSKAKWDLRRAIGDYVRRIPSSVFTFIDLQYTFMLQSFGLIRSNTLREPVYRRPSYFAMQNVYSYFDEEVQPVGVTTNMVNGKVLSIATMERRSVPVYVLWYSGERPGDSLSYERARFPELFAALKKHAESQGEPVWVDLMTGKVCELADDEIPIWDSPVMVTCGRQVPRRKDKSNK